MEKDSNIDMQAAYMEDTVDLPPITDRLDEALPSQVAPLLVPPAALAEKGLHKVARGVLEGAKALGSIAGSAIGVVLTGEHENPFKK